MNHEKLIAELIEIKKSIIKNAPDCLFMDTPGNETVCERIDYILDELGVSSEEMEKNYLNEGE